MRGGNPYVNIFSVWTMFGLAVGLRTDIGLLYCLSFSSVFGILTAVSWIQFGWTGKIFTIIFGVLGLFIVVPYIASKDTRGASSNNKEVIPVGESSNNKKIVSVKKDRKESSGFDNLELSIENQEVYQPVSTIGNN